MTLTPDDLIGYVERDFDADVARWFPDAERAEVPAATRSIDYLVGRLPVSGSAALTAFDERVRSGRVPAVLDIAYWSYGFDFAGNDCGIRDGDHATVVSGEDVFTLAADGSGNLWTLLVDGQVAVWFHEEEVLEADTRFDHLDVFLWSLVRFHAVRAGRLSLAEVEADFLALGQGGVVAPEVGMLAYLKD